MSRSPKQRAILNATMVRMTEDVETAATNQKREIYCWNSGITFNT